MRKIDGELDLGLDTDICKTCNWCNKIIYKDQYRYNKTCWVDVKYCSKDCCNDKMSARHYN